MRLIRRLAHWIRARTHRAELEDELAFHRDMVERDLIVRGSTPDAARIGARRAMGNETLSREDARSVWVWWWLDALRQDAAYTIRSLRKSPGFTAAVVLTLALGLGANAAMFAVLDRILFRPPPRLIDPATVHRVYLYRTSEGIEAERSGQYRRYTDLAAWTSSFAQTAAVEERALPVGTGDATRELPIGIVTASFFSFFDAPAALGRYFTPAEDRPPVGAAVAVLTNAAWKTRYAGRRDVIGSTIAIGSTRFTVIGVAPAGFVGLWAERPPIAFIPVSAFGPINGRDTNAWWSSYGHAIGISTIVRRKPGVSVATATADLTTALRRSYQHQIDVELPNGPWTLASLRPRAVVASILSERGPEASSFARVALWLSGVALIVLLIACANVANLLLARTLQRRREIAVRIALGVSRVRLASQLVLEGLLLAILAGVAGVVSATWTSSAMQRLFLPDDIAPRVITDARTTMFAIGIAVIVGIATGIVPALHIGRRSLTADLKAGAREGVYQHARLRGALLVAQTALSVLLLVGAGLFVRSLRNVRNVPLGYDAEPVLVVDLNLRGVALDSAHLAALNERLLATSLGVTGVEHATFTKTVPFEGIMSTALFVAGIDSVDRLGEFDLNGVSPDYFATMGTRILHGRGFLPSDGPRSAPVMIVDASMAHALWPRANAIGECVRLAVADAPCTTVVGIAEDVHTHTVGDERGNYFYYLPAAQMKPEYTGLFLRARNPRQLAPVLRSRLQAEMPGASYVTVRPFREVVNDQERSWAIGAEAFSALGGLALGMAALGLYSVIAYGVAQRKHELGVRVALGARSADITRLVVGESVRFALLGLAIGACASLGAAHWIAPLLFQESPHDPVVFGVAGLVLIAAAIAASWLPARRASHIDPTTALQCG
ncbi:MAG TPA: ADOP family duplicated permease [Gemmatimonadaceae bacterium]|nr:ADOP family duplicated permease [Gemmatimonadaceae bacterium]